MRFAISVPQFVAGDTFDHAGLGAFVRRAEELGFESAWTQEQVVGPWPNVGAVETMAFAAAHTERLRLGCAVFVTPLHNPVHLAKTLSSLDQISGGRTEIGIGTGGPNRPFAAFGVDGARYVARFTEGLLLMKELWTKPNVTFDGEFWQLKDEVMAPRPVQRPHPPIWFGGSAPAALRRAARHGDGFFGAGSTTTANFAEQVSTVRAALAEVGRDPAEFHTAKRVYIDVDDDPERARRRADDGLVSIYGDFGATLRDVPVVGTADDCVRGVRAVAEAGAERILFTPFHDHAGQMERLAAEVIPQLAPPTR
jgi:probable F420-dependent oxidoreductase